MHTHTHTHTHTHIRIHKHALTNIGAEAKEELVPHKIKVTSEWSKSFKKVILQGEPGKTATLEASASIEGFPDMQKATTTISFVTVCMYLCLCLCLYLCEYVSVCVCVYVCVLVSVRVSAYIPACVSCTHIHVPLRTVFCRVRVFVCWVCMCVRVCVLFIVPNMCVCVSASVHMCVRAFVHLFAHSVPDENLCANLCVRAWMCL